MNVALGSESDFSLGALEISPSACRVRRPDGAEERVEARVMEVLVVLARAEGRTVTRDQLIEACWEGRAVSDDAVTRVIAKLRQLARGTDPAPFTVETVPKVGFRLLAGVASSSTGPSSPPLNRPWRRLWPVLAIAGVALVSVAALALRATPSDGRVHVVPFEVRSAPEEDARLADLVGDAFVPVLAANAMAAPLKGGQSAEFVIAGAVNREGGAPTVTPRVIERRSGLVLWSQRFEGLSGGEAALAEEAAVKTAAVLNCAVEDRRTARRALSPDVMGLVLQACWGGLADGTALLEKSARAMIEAAPRLSLGHAFLALATAETIDEAGTPEEAQRRRDEVRRIAAHALALDPRSSRAHMALANAVEESGDWAEREKHLRKALEIQPNLAPAIMRYVMLLREVGRLREARELAIRLHSRADPRPILSLPILIILLASQGDMDAAYARVAQLERLHPSYAPGVRWLVLVWWDDPEKALRLHRSWQPGRRAAEYDCVDAMLRAVSANARRRVLPPACHSFSADWRLRMHARLGNVDAAFALLKEPSSMRNRILLYYPELRAVRADPRFMQHAADIGLLDYWRSTGHWPDFCAEPELPYRCGA
ncbi:MAG: winged helix-turn-helix domain-containing protein [Hyphomonadaceae bacterium]|nr:winged helix-turn-helix domain-containing protein [Hyphomonadaceae bacterium]